MEPLILWKSHYSIGKSILTLDDPKDCLQGGPDSIFQLCLELNLKTVTLVENALTGFPSFIRGCEKHSFNPVFGLKLAMRNSVAPEDENSEHFIVVFAKDAAGCKLLNKISTKSNCDFDSFLTYEELKKLWDSNHLKLAIPFYDSFIHKNNFTFANAVPDLSFCKFVCFVESNNVSFDHLLKQKVEKFAFEQNAPILQTKSVYYRAKKDIKAFMTYRIICDRKFSKNRSFEKPELPHFSSDEFCAEI